MEEYDFFAKFRRLLDGKNDDNPANIRSQGSRKGRGVRISWMNEYLPMELRQCFSAGIWPGG